jgi:hypothetical protein
MLSFSAQKILLREHIDKEARERYHLIILRHIFRNKAEKRWEKKVELTNKINSLVRCFQFLIYSPSHNPHTIARYKAWKWATKVSAWAKYSFYSKRLLYSYFILKVCQRECIGKKTKIFVLKSAIRIQFVIIPQKFRVATYFITIPKAEEMRRKLYARKAFICIHSVCSLKTFEISARLPIFLMLFEKSEIQPFVLRYYGNIRKEKHNNLWMQ